MDSEREKQKEKKGLGNINILKNKDELRVLVDENMKKMVNTKNLNLLLSDKIFIQEDEDRRVFYSHMSNFY